MVNPKFQGSSYSNKSVHEQAGCNSPKTHFHMTLLICVLFLGVFWETKIQILHYFDVQNIYMEGFYLIIMMPF